MTAVPFALPAMGVYTVSDGLWMFLYHQSLCCSVSLRRASKPGAPFGHSGMTCCAPTHGLAAINAQSGTNRLSRVETGMAAQDAIKRARGQIPMGRSVGAVSPAI